MTSQPRFEWGLFFRSYIILRLDFLRCWQEGWVSACCIVPSYAGGSAFLRSSELDGSEFDFRLTGILSISNEDAAEGYAEATDGKIPRRRRA